MRDTVRLTPVLKAVDLDDVAAEVASQAPAPHAPSSLLRRLLVGVDAVAVLTGWALALLFAGGPEIRSSVGGVAELAVLALLAAISMLAITSQRLYLARFCT